MPVLSEVLERLGLAEYHTSLVENGFHSWETVLDITEDDFTALSFKLGHRRALQREIATFRGLPTSDSLETDMSSIEQSPLSASALESFSRTSVSLPPREKRRYRRHPRPDHNAPKKPKTAYVNFADQLRTDNEVASLSFIDIAKEVGRQWQVLPPEKKRIWESHAARAMQEYEAQMDEYKKTESWRKYQAYLDDFKAQQLHTKNKTGNVKRSDSSRGPAYQREFSRGSPSSSGSPISVPSSTGTESEVCHNNLTLAFSELVSLRGEILGQGVQPYDHYHPPPEELTRRAMYAFVQGTGSLLYMWTFAEVDEILDRIYRPRKQVDAMTLSECFTIAAMGAHYDVECFPDRLRRVLYASGTLHFHEKTARADYFRSMRLLLSMSFYAILEKHLSARYLVAAGLQIARWKCPSPESKQDATSENWRKIFRSLIFMDCWLSYTLGYGSEVSKDDVATAYAYVLEGTTTTEMIHIQTGKIGLVAAEIAKTLASPELVTRENIDLLTRKLDQWRSEVPPALQLSLLTSNAPTELDPFQKRAILMVHVMYLGALVLLYRQLLVATAETQLTDGAAWALDLSVDDARRYRDECSVAAQHIARILRLIASDGTPTKRCWIMIYWSFSGCIVLLFCATTKLLEGQTNGVEMDLQYAKDCMDILAPCRNHEPVAARYLDMLSPLYESLHDLHHRMLGRAKTSISSLLHPMDPNLISPPIPVSKSEIGPTSEKLSILLTDPFGRKQGSNGDNSMRRVLNADGSCSVFWWR